MGRLESRRQQGQVVSLQPQRESHLLLYSSEINTMKENELTNLDEPSDPPIKEYPGIGRVGYILLSIGLVLAGSLFASSAAKPNFQGEVDQSIILIGTLIKLFCFALPTYPRLKNIGYNPLISLLAFIPLINLIVFFQCLTYPAGYRYSKKMDRAGNIFSIFILVIVAVGLISMML